MLVKLMTDPFWRGFLSGLVASLISGLFSFWLSKWHSESVRARDARTAFQMFLRSSITGIPESHSHYVLEYYRGIKSETLRELDRLWVFLDKSRKIKNDNIRAYFDRELPNKISAKESEFERDMHKAFQQFAAPPCPDAPPHGETLKKAFDEMMKL